MSDKTLSIIAIIISFISAGFVIFDKLKTYMENSNIKKLKREKSILQVILDLDIDKLCSVEVRQTSNRHATIYKAEHSKIYHIFQSINTNKISNKNIASSIEKIKKQKGDELIKLVHLPNSPNFSQHFNADITELIYDIKLYLAPIL